MAVPTAMTATLLVTEAWNKVGTDDPSNAQITRAEDYFLEEIMHDICQRTDEYKATVKLKSLQTLSTDITVIGVSKYAFPSDFEEEISISFLDGTHADTATAGANTTITLAADEDATEAEVEGKHILITGGTGENGFRQATDYDTDTLIVTVDSAWDTNPDNTSTYRIINRVIDLEEDTLNGMGALGNTTFNKSDPTTFMKVSEAENTYYILDNPPDASTYGLLIRYYADILLVDVTSDLVTKLYRKWRTALVQGVAWKIAENDDDDKYGVLKGEYERLVRNLLVREKPYESEFAGFEL